MAEALRVLSTESARSKPALVSPRGKRAPCTDSAPGRHQATTPLRDWRMRVRPKSAAMHTIIPIALPERSWPSGQPFARHAALHLMQKTFWTQVRLSSPELDLCSRGSKSEQAWTLTGFERACCLKLNAPPLVREKSCGVKLRGSCLFSCLCKPVCLPVR